MMMSSLVNAKNADGKANLWEQHTKQGKAGESWLIVWGFFYKTFLFLPDEVFHAHRCCGRTIVFFSDFSEFYLPLGFL